MDQRVERGPRWTSAAEFVSLAFPRAPTVVTNHWVMDALPLTEQVSSRYRAGIKQVSSRYRAVAACFLAAAACFLAKMNSSRERCTLLCVMALHVAQGVAFGVAFGVAQVQLRYVVGVCV